MPFTIPNAADAFNENQAEPDSIDIDILVAAYNGTGVISGCAVTAQGTPDMTVAVASGVVIVNDGTPVQASVASGNVTITAADGTNPRIDLVVANNAGTKSATAGTPDGNPVAPSIPSNSVVLAMVYIPAGDTDIDANQITDKRVLNEVQIQQLAALTASEAVVTDASGFLTTSSGVSATEVGYLNGVTSAIQTQIDGKIADVSGSPLDELSDVSSHTPTKGNLLIADGDSWEVLTVGANDQVITADSAEALGIKWAASSGGMSNVVEDTTPQLGGELDAQGEDITAIGVLTLTEQAAAEADVAGRGQIWVKTATPNELWFTDDAGTDFKVATLDGIETFTNKAIDADGTGNSITNIGASEVKADIITGQPDLTGVAGTDELLLSDAGTLKKIDAADVVVAIPYIIPIIMEIPQGTNAYADIRSMSTGTAKKISGFRLIDSTGVTSTVNWKLAFPIPDVLPSNPVYTLRTTILTLGAVAGPQTVALTVRSLAFADGEDMDVALTAETQATPTMPTTDDTIDVYDEPLGITIAAGDFIIGQIERDSASDAFTADIMVINMALIITGS